MKQDDPVEAGTGNHSARPVIAPLGARPDPVSAGLQKMFAAIADEPIPDDFLRLLDEIEASSKGTTQ